MGRLHTTTRYSLHSWRARRHPTASIHARSNVFCEDVQCVHASAARTIAVGQGGQSGTMRYVDDLSSGILYRTWSSAGPSLVDTLTT